ncbi:TPA: GIY-YIG nuclease family protein, partial [Clostridium perfringens]|nr:GIY-YIG nuclease family protein [Clostridium perfringens]
QSREYYIKKLTRNQKLQLISSKSIEEENYEKEINL